MPLHLLLHRWRERTLFHLGKPDFVTRGKGYLGTPHWQRRASTPRPSRTTAAAAAAARRVQPAAGLAAGDLESGDYPARDADASANRDGPDLAGTADLDGNDGVLGVILTDESLGFPEGAPNPWFAPLYHALRMVSECIHLHWHVRVGLH